MSLCLIYQLRISGENIKIVFIGKDAEIIRGKVCQFWSLEDIKYIGKSPKLINESDFSAFDRLCAISVTIFDDTIALRTSLKINDFLSDLVRSLDKNKDYIISLSINNNGSLIKLQEEYPDSFNKIIDIGNLASIYKP